MTELRLAITFLQCAHTSTMKTVNCDNVQEKPTGPRPDHLLANSKNRTLSLCNNLHILHILEFYLNLTETVRALKIISHFSFNEKQKIQHSQTCSPAATVLLCEIVKYSKQPAKKSVDNSFLFPFVPFTSLCRRLCFLFYVEQFSHVFATLSTLKSSLPRFAFSVLRVLCAIVAVLAEREKLTLKVEVQIR